MTVSNTSSLMSFQACMVASVDVSPSRADLATRPVEPDFTRCVGRGVGRVGVGMGHASLASYEGGRLSRAGKERASLARCVGRGVGGVGVGMGHASLASYGGGRLSRAGARPTEPPARRRTAHPGSARRSCRGAH